MRGSGAILGYMGGFFINFGVCGGLYIQTGVAAAGCHFAVLLLGSDTEWFGQAKTALELTKLFRTASE